MSEIHGPDPADFCNQQQKMNYCNQYTQMSYYLALVITSITLEEVIRERIGTQMQTMTHGFNKKPLIMNTRKTKLQIRVTIKVDHSNKSNCVKVANQAL